MNETQRKKLAVTAAKARLAAMDAVFTCASGHIGGSLSAMDILTTLYFDKMAVDPQKPDDPGRDRFVLSKGHASPALYSVLALRGFFPMEDLKLFRSIEGHMSGHPDMRHVKGVDMSTGSLGQGISAACGMALAGKIDCRDYRVYTILGDGESQEGQVWEAAMAAAKYKLDNLTAFTDVNGLQIDGSTNEVMPLGELGEKWRSFGWNVLEIDGHDYAAISGAVDKAAACKGKPTMILAHTTKGKGVSFMENQASWHGKAPDAQQYKQACDELSSALNALEGGC